MFDSRNLRLVASITRQERLQSRSQLSGVRLFSSNVHKIPARPHLHHRPRQTTSQISCWQQTRSLSLFGWGPSKSADPEFSKVHSNEQAGGSQQTVYEKWDAGTASSSPTPIKAVHATSDAPATSTLPHTPEPQVLHDIENAIAAPHPIHGTETLLAAKGELSAVPERIGYLKEVCGLDYGWGPAAFLEFVVEHIHIFGGFTWATSIIGSAVLIRLLVLRPSLQSSNISIRMKQANPILEPLRAEYKEATIAKDNVKQAQAAAQMRMIMKEYNITYGKLLLPILIQVPLSFGGFRLFRGMTALPVPALETEKWLWMSDLSQSDPFPILPIVSAASLYFSMKLGTETGAGPMQGGLGQSLKVALPLISMAFIYSQPGAVQIFFCTTSLLSLCQTVLLRNALIRRWLGLLPFPPKASSSPGSAAPGGLRTWQDPNSSHALEPQKRLAPNVSVVDRYVDAAKGRYTNIKDTVLGKTEDKVAARNKDNFASKAEKYEITRRQQAEWERETRNKSKATASYNGKDGTDMIDELVEEDEVKTRPTTSKARNIRSTGIRR